MLGAAGTSHVNPTKRLMLELSPMYLMFAIFSSQPHKEERFLFVVYPLICLAGAVAVYQARAWLELSFSMSRKLKVWRSLRTFERKAVAENPGKAILSASWSGIGDWLPRINLLAVVVEDNGVIHAVPRTVARLRTYALSSTIPISA